MIDIKSGDTDHPYVWIKPKVKRRKAKGDPAPCQHDGAVEAFVKVGDGFDWVAHEVTR